MVRNNTITWTAILLLTLGVCIGCGGGSAGGDSVADGSGISPYIQSETQADTGRDIIPLQIYIEISPCAKTYIPELELRHIRRVLRIAETIFDENLGYWTLTPEIAPLAAAYLRERSVEVTIENGVTIRTVYGWASGMHRVGVIVSPNLDEFVFDVQPNPSCVPPTPVLLDP